MRSTQLRQLTNESEPGSYVRLDNVLEEAREAGIVAPITNNITQEDFSKLEIFVKLTKNNNRRSGAGSLTMIVQNDKYNELEFHRTTRYSELKTLASLIEKKKGKKLALGFPGSLCDKTSTYSKKCTRTRTYNIQEYFNNVIYVYGKDGWEENDEFLEFLQDKQKWKTTAADLLEEEKSVEFSPHDLKTVSRVLSGRGGKKTRKRKRKGKRKSRKRKKSLKKRRRERKRRKRTKRRR